MPCPPAFYDFDIKNCNMILNKSFPSPLFCGIMLKVYSYFGVFLRNSWELRQMKREILAHIPQKIGMRNIKTATAAALCALIYALIDRSPAFACIGAIFGMGSDLSNSKLHGGNRFFGTIIGGLLGIALYRVHLIFYPGGGRTWLLVPLTFVGVVVLILLCQTFWVGGVQPGGVVLCILLFNTPVDNYVAYALNRMLDTGIGVLAALFINSCFPGGFTFNWMRGLRRNAPSPKPENQN